MLKNYVHLVVSLGKDGTHSIYKKLEMLGLGALWFLLDFFIFTAIAFA